MNGNEVFRYDGNGCAGRTGAATRTTRVRDDRFHGKGRAVRPCVVGSRGGEGDGQRTGRVTDDGRTRQLKPTYEELFSNR